MPSAVLAEQRSEGPSQTVDPARSTGRALLALTRPSHVLKNLVIVPLVVLAWPTWTLHALSGLAWIIVTFTLASSIIYVLNDVLDRDRDRLHPVKRLRPIAAGEVSVGMAWSLVLVLGTLLGAVAFIGPTWAAWPVAVYLSINIVYSRWLKHVPLLEVFILATGFVLRLIAGVAAVSAPLSGWLMLSVLSACLLLGLGKRRHELAVATKGYHPATHRPSLRTYSVQLLDYLILLTAGIAMSSFMSYLAIDAVVDELGRIPLILASLPALFATCRYLQLLIVHGAGGDPVRLLIRDRALVISGLCLFLCFAAAYIAAKYHHLITYIAPGVR